LHVVRIPLIDDDESRQVALALRGFVLQQVVLERFTANNLAAPGLLEPLGSGLASFEFGHGFAFVSDNLHSL
jgi:hypothetical protein